jgi:hypothetical protein
MFRQAVYGTENLMVSFRPGVVTAEIFLDGKGCGNLKPGGAITMGKRRFSLYNSNSLLELQDGLGTDYAESLSFFLGAPDRFGISNAYLAHRHKDRTRLIWFASCAIYQSEPVLTPSDYVFLLSRCCDGSLPGEFTIPLLQKAFQSWPGHPALNMFQQRMVGREGALRHLSQLGKVTHLTALNEDELATMQHGPYIYYFPVSLSLSKVEVCQEALLRAEKQLRGYLAAPGEIEILIYSFPESQNSVYGMTVEGAVCLNLNYIDDLTRFRNTVKHEYIHVLQHHDVNASPARHLPLWLDEGMAHVLAGNTLKAEASEWTMSIVKIEEFLRAEQDDVTDEERNAALCSACRYVEKLLSQVHSEDVILAARQVFDMVTRGESFKERHG